MRLERLLWIVDNYPGYDSLRTFWFSPRVNVWRGLSNIYEGNSWCIPFYWNQSKIYISKVIEYLEVEKCFIGVFI